MIPSGERKLRADSHFSATSLLPLSVFRVSMEEIIIHDLLKFFCIFSLHIDSVHNCTAFSPDKDFPLITILCLGTGCPLSTLFPSDGDLIVLLSHSFCFVFVVTPATAFDCIAMHSCHLHRSSSDVKGSHRLTQNSFRPLNRITPKDRYS